MLNPTGSALLIGLLFLGLGRVSAEDYAARYKQLQDQKAADVQIESMLKEWRDRESTKEANEK